MVSDVRATRSCSMTSVVERWPPRPMLTSFACAGNPGYELLVASVALSRADPDVLTISNDFQVHITDLEVVSLLSHLADR